MTTWDEWVRRHLVDGAPARRVGGCKGARCKALVDRDHSLWCQGCRAAHAKRRKAAA